MGRLFFRGMAAMAAVLVCEPALADDPHDRMTPEELERDRETIRRLNRQQLEYVRKRDAGYAEGWRTYGGPRRSAREEQTSAYEADLRRYQRAMAEWREDVAACRAGHYEHCRR
jgi:hypothetical protein